MEESFWLVWDAQFTKFEFKWKCYLKVVCADAVSSLFIDYGFYYIQIAQVFSCNTSILLRRQTCKHKICLEFKIFSLVIILSLLVHSRELVQSRI